MVEELFKIDPMVSYIRDNSKKTPLHLAAENGQVSIVKALLEYCWDTIEMVDDKQRNILHLAAMIGNVDVVKYILTLAEMEDLANSPDVDGNTPSHLAATHCHIDVVRLLSMKRIVEIIAKNKSNMTPLAIVKFSTHCLGMELQKHLTLKALKTGYKQKSLNPEDVDVGFPVEYGKESMELGQTISVMSTMIDTFTFAAVFTIPGGLNSDDHDPDVGMVMLISDTAFKAFVISNSIAMTSSFTVAVIVFWASSGRDTESFMDTLPFAIGLTWISLISMAVAFVTGLFVVLQKTYWLAALVTAIGCSAPFFIYIFTPIVLLVIERVSKARTSPSERQNMVYDNPFFVFVHLMKMFVRGKLIPFLDH